MMNDCSISPLDELLFVNAKICQDGGDNKEIVGLICKLLIDGTEEMNDFRRNMIAQIDLDKGLDVSDSRLDELLLENAKMREGGEDNHEVLAKIFAVLIEREE